VLRKVEQALQSAIEKPFSRLFPQKLQPPELKAGLREAMESSALATAEGSVVCNGYGIALSPRDYAEIAAVGPALERELAAYLQEFAAEARLICGPYLTMTIGTDEGVPHGQMGVQAEFGERVPAYLQAEAGLPERDRKVALADSRVIGRSPDGDIVIGDEAVSRRHCEIAWQYVQYVVRDLQSANGTFVNGQQVQAAALRDGDLLEVGLAHLRFHDGATE
jgi:hypothetical protein